MTALIQVAIKGPVIPYTCLANLSPGHHFSHVLQGPSFVDKALLISMTFSSGKLLHSSSSEHYSDDNFSIVRLKQY